MRRPWKDRAGQWWQACHHCVTDLLADNSGTTLTEFVITLPVMIIIFWGILVLGDLSRHAVATVGTAGVDMFDQMMDRQQSGSNDDLLSEMQADAEHLSPAPAAESAITQLTDHPPRQKSFAKAAVVAAERRAYFFGDALTTHGHLGESYGRLWPLAQVRLEPPGLEGIVTPETRRLFGQGNRSSRFARDLIFDGYSYDFGIGDCQSVIGTVGGAVNELISGAGARPMLAAGVRYGTITGSAEYTANYPYMSRHFEPAFTVTVAPHVFEEDWTQPALAVVVTRFAMENCTLAPYTGLLGVTQQPHLPSSSNPNTRLQVPVPERTFGDPFNYAEEGP